MIFYSIVIVALIAFVVGFVRTPTFGGHVRNGKSAGQSGIHADGVQYNDWKDLPPRD
jgi:hypothetical protein